MNADARDLDPLDPDLADLFASERRRPGLSDERGERLLGRVVAQLTTPSGSGNDGGANPASSQTSTPAVSTVGRALSTRAALLLGGAVGVLAGAAGHARWQRPPEPRVVRVVERVVERVEVPVPVAVSPTAPEPTAGPAVAPRLQPVAAPVAPALDREREGALLERARTAMLRGRPADGLEALDEHARSFPRGRLVEEREALAVQCLSASGEGQRARARAEAFQRRFPGSPLTEVVLATIR